MEPDGVSCPLVYNVRREYAQLREIHNKRLEPIERFDLLYELIQERERHCLMKWVIVGVVAFVFRFQPILIKLIDFISIGCSFSQRSFSFMHYIKNDKLGVYICLVVG